MTDSVSEAQADEAELNELDALKVIQGNLLDFAETELDAHVATNHGVGSDKDAVDKGLNTVKTNVKAKLNEAFALLGKAVNNHANTQTVGPLVNRDIRTEPGALGYYQEQFTAKVQHALHERLDIFEEFEVGSDNDAEKIEKQRKRTGEIKKSEYISGQPLINEIGSLLARIDHMITSALVHLEPKK